MLFMNYTGDVMKVTTSAAEAITTQEPIATSNFYECLCIICLCNVEENI